MAGPRPAEERLRRLLVVLPWLMERGRVPVADLAARFQVPTKQIVRDLELASMCGLPPYLDQLIDLHIDGADVVVGVPRLFTRPLRLSAHEGFALLAAGRAALELPGADRDGPLARALDKLAAVLGRPRLDVAIEDPPLLDVVRGAVDTGERLAITYWSVNSDEVSHRIVTPHALGTDRGRWYVVADDDRSGEIRTFRVDRIQEAVGTGEHVERRTVAMPAVGELLGGEDATEAVLVLPASARWVVETYPTRAVETLPGGRLRVRLVVTAARWLERLLLRVGPEAVVEEPARWRDLGAEAAARVLGGYSA